MHNVQYDEMLLAAYASFLDEVYLKTDQDALIQSTLIFLPSNELIWSSIKEFYEQLDFMKLEHDHAKTK